MKTIKTKSCLFACLCFRRILFVLTMTTMTTTMPLCVEAFVGGTIRTSTRTFTSTSTRTSTLLHALGHPAHHVRQQKVQAAMQSNNFVRGKLLLFMSKFWVPPSHYLMALQRIFQNTSWTEVALILALTTQSINAAEWIYRSRPSVRRQIWPPDDDNEDDDDEAKHNEREDRFDAMFLASKSWKFARVLQELGRIQGVLYVSDVCLVFLKLMNFEFVVKYQAQCVVGSVLFATWLARTTSKLKYWYLQGRGRSPKPLSISSKSSLSQRESAAAANTTTTTTNFDVDQPLPNANGSTNTINNNINTAVPSVVAGTPTMGVYNRFANRVLDVLIYASAFLAVVDILGIQIGFALKSIFGLGSFGTLVLSLASKDVAAEFVGGLMIQTNSFFDEGENVILQDGTRGQVVKIGWLHTYIHKDESDGAGGEDLIVRVPNSQISHQRIARKRRRNKSLSSSSAALSALAQRRRNMNNNPRSNQNKRSNY